MVNVKPARLSFSSASGAQNDAKDEEKSEKSKMTVASPEKCCKRPGGSIYRFGRIYREKPGVSEVVIFSLFEVQDVTNVYPGSRHADFTVSKYQKPPIWDDEKITYVLSTWTTSWYTLKTLKMLRHHERMIIYIFLGEPFIHHHYKSSLFR